MNYLKEIFKSRLPTDTYCAVSTETPVTSKTNDKQVRNSASGFVYQVSDRDRLMRFLILGSEGGTYYIKEKPFTQANAENVKRLIATDGEYVVQTVLDVSQSGKAAKNDPALFVLAMCASFGSDETKAAALAALPQVARIGTHLFHFAEFVDGMRGWGRGLRNAFGKWYTDKTPSELALQIVKYKQRDGWSHADILRKSHPKKASVHNDIFKYAVDGWESVGEDPHPDAALAIIWAAERLKTADEAEVLKLISDYHLPMEVVPTEKRTTKVYEALLPHAPIGWLIRNLGNLSKAGVLATGQYSNLNAVCEKLTDVEYLKRGRIHPLGVLVAHNTYKAGKGVKGSGEWPVVSKVVDALDTAFELAFQAIEPTGVRFMLGLDVSGSMGFSEVAGMPGITPRIGSAAMAMVTARTETNVATMAFTALTGSGNTRQNSAFTEFPIGRKDSLDSVVKKMEAQSFGGTDCALPMKWSLENRVEADAFVVYTDSETWAGGHPVEALKDYRETMGIPARLIVVGMTASEFTIADPNDRGMLDVVGFSADAPNVISQFAAGKL